MQKFRKHLEEYSETDSSSDSEIETVREDCNLDKRPKSKKFHFIFKEEVSTEIDGPLHHRGHLSLFLVCRAGTIYWNFDNINTEERQ